MSGDLHLATLFGFAALMAAAALADYDRLVIPNRLPVLLAMLWPAYFATLPSAAPFAAVEAAAAALAVFIAGTLLFMRGLLGGGDVKLLSAAALWTGPDRLPSLLLLTGLFGGLLALFFLTPLGAQITASRRIGSGSAELAPGMAPMPYGVAIAAAALVATLPARFV